MTFTLPAGTALVTGASSGIGEAFADRLARDGHDLVVVARRTERLEALAQRLHERDGVRVEVLTADLTRADDLQRVEERAARDDLGLLINNAGFGGYMPFVELPAERAEDLIGVHVLAATRLARAVLPGMLARGRGAIVNVASMLAFSGPLPPSPLPARAVYVACKSYLVAFSELLAGEVASSGVQIQVLCPGVVKTEFHTIQGRDMSRSGLRGAQPEEVVEASLEALSGTEVICIPQLPDHGPLEQLRQDQLRLFSFARSSQQPSP